MVGELITLPLRVGVRATQLWLRAAAETVAVVADATGRLIDRAVPRQAAAAGAPTAREAAPGPAAHATTFEEPEAEIALEREPGEPGIEPVERQSEPVHVSEEPVLVEEVAEPGAEDGAGAAVHVEEPWKGYEQLKADEVVARLAGATPAELAAIQLYESERKGRVTVLEAVQRELRISSGSGSHR